MRTVGMQHRMMVHALCALKDLSHRFEQAFRGNACRHMLLKWKEPAPLGAPNNIVTTNIRFERENQATAFRRWYMTPRYLGDVANPRGGVRGVIPAKQNY